MKMMLKFVVAFVLLFAHAARAVIVENDQSFLLATPLTHSTFLDAEQKVLLQWGTASDSVIVLQMSAPARGYLGFGLSPNGGMPNSDILLMWVDDRDNTAHVEARYAVANAEPTLDAVQASVLAYEGAQNATHTRVKVARTINAACSDPQGHRRNIEKSAMRIIYSYSDTDPDASTGRAKYHGPKHRGAATLYLLDDMSGEYEQDKAAALRDATKVWQFVDSNVSSIRIQRYAVRARGRYNYQAVNKIFKIVQYALPAVMTRYQNTFYQLPAFTSDIQILGFEPVVDGRNVRIVHHFAVRICDRDFVGTSDNTKPYDSALFGKDDINAQIKAAKCLKPAMWVWGIGGDGMYMPRDVGWKLSKQDSKRWIMIEVHYNNPELLSNVVDSSGVRFLIRDELPLRPHDAGMLEVMFATTPEQIIPSRQVKPFTTVDICPPECTKKFVPTGGVRAFGVFMHAHVVGRSMAFRHWRNGKELRPIAADSTYDFNYQEWRPINVTIMPGDLLVVDCNYTTPDRAVTTFGGEPTTAEMCMGFLLTTPPMGMSACASMTPRKAMLDAILTDKEQDALGFRSDPEGMPNLKQIISRKLNHDLFNDQQKKMLETFTSYTWTPKTIKKLQDVYTDAQQWYYCFRNGNESEFEFGMHSPSKDLNWKPFAPPAADCDAVVDV